MQKFRSILGFFLLLTATGSRAQNNANIIQYIRTYKDMAIAEMQRSGVPASIKLAQGIHETLAGTSDLVQRSNNHFGIKCKSTWTGESVTHDDDLKGECFRKYPSAEDSYRDHSDFLRSGQRYAFLFALDPTDYNGWAWGLKKAGYATSPKYATALIRLIEDYHLQDYTLIALGKMKPEDQTDLVMDKGEIKTEPVTTASVVTDNPVYPEGKFLINDTKVVFARSGTSYLAIARQYDVDLSKIYEFNEIPRTEMTEKDQLVFLQHKKKTGNNDFHTVKEGETLHDIAQAEAIRLENLLELNDLKPGDRPAAGELLSLKKKAAAAPRLAGKNAFSSAGVEKTKTIN